MTSATTEIPGFVAGTWDIDPTHSEVGFSVRHMGGISKVKGRFTAFSGTVTTTEDLAAAGVEVSVDLDSIHTGNADRDGHLKTADFFEVEKYPTMTYQATGVRADGDKYVLDGELTLKDVTRTVPLTFEFNGFGGDAYGGTRIGAEGKAHINRKDFNVNFGGVQNNVVVVGDKVEITIDIEAVLRTG
ncbi:YceI family protein [Actinokineospora pegani]|uniref:YceI family protein n=1 Tax=Actinokineospora pegani TaxID=2654637 RepID=UPI0012E9E125|nr:YceI family protein [Actinokineospora pegani]